MKIDSHQHFWQYDAVEYDWIDDSMSILKNDYTAADLKAVQLPTGFEGSIAVQARQSLEENDFLLGGMTPQNNHSNHY